MDGFASTQGKVIRAPSLKRGRPDERISERVKLERVLGVTVSNNAALDSDTNSETVAYPAGCTVVLFNSETGDQSHIINTSRKTITSLAFSSCGRYLVTGECGHQPAVRVWDLQADPQPGAPGIAPQVQQVAEFFSHKYGISCVAFSPSGKYVVSIGTQHDMIVNVWDWKNNIKVASNKVSTKVKALAFAENGSYFVTVGNRHVKFWFLEYGKAKYKEAVPLMGRSAILGEQRNNYFCDVACGKAQCGDSTYAITRSGLLCEFNNRRLLDKWVELRTSSANCITVGKTYIFVGCAEGIVRCFDPTTLRFVTTLPRTHYLGVDVSQGLNITHMSSPPPDAKYPDAIAITYDETNKKLTCVYNDHSIYVWDIHNIRRVGKSHSFLYHSACIWGVEMSPSHCPLPPGSFLTCSSDDTIRVWTLDKLNDKNARGVYQRNIYSNELLKVVYIDSDMTYLKDLDISTSNAGNDKQDSSYDGRNGVRAIRLSPDGKQLASGDRAGNIRILETKGMTEDFKIEAHDAEVLCLEYSQIDFDKKLLASASRDRLIHVFDVNKGYDFLQTLDDHSSSITAVRFLNTHGNLQMVSCGADKSLIFRSLNDTSAGIPQFVRDHNATGKTTLYDMDVDSGQKHVLTACQDRNVRIYSVNTGKHTKIFKGSTGDDGTLIKISLDRSGIYLATSCTDKSLSVYDYYTGECMATMCGHSELATGLRFTNDCRRLISASGDGCIFVWRVPHDMVVTMHARLSQQAMRQGKTLDNELFTDHSSADFYDTNANSVENDYTFSVGALPLWAKKHISDDSTLPTSLMKGVAAPKGRWAQRAERSIDRRGDSDKDSSLDSGTETKQSLELIRDSKITTKQVTINSLTSREFRRSNLTDDSAVGGSVRDTDIESTAHDADIDSDQEYRHQPLYYPSQVDSASGSEFTITNMDADELRKSQRKKRGNVPSITIQPISISGSQDSDDDDDEVSTPSGENTDRNPMSILSVSSESLDQIVNREKYLQSTFESLSGAEVETSPGNKSSISSQYLTRANSVCRNQAVISAAKQTKRDSDASRKREELAKRIAATRKKLQSVGYSSPLRCSQSIHDLSHIPEKDKWNSASRKPECDMLQESLQLPSSFSLPSNLQLCGCYMKDFMKNTNPSFFSPAFNRVASSNDIEEKAPAGNVKLSDLERNPRPRKLHLDKMLNKYKLHKSLPVSPVNEERSFSDFVPKANGPRRSFSYFVDFDQNTSTVDGFKQVCSDIEKFSEDFSKKNEQMEQYYSAKIGDIQKELLEEGGFSSDSLEDCSFNSTQIKKAKKYKLPRRCLSNNEIYRYQMDAYQYEIPKSESFYLNPSNKNSQDSILSDDYGEQKTESYCNSLESVLSCESDCKSAPLEALFSAYKRPSCASVQLEAGDYGGSLPKNYSARMKTSQTQTDFSFQTPQEIVAKRNPSNSDFQRKLLKFETCIADTYTVQHRARDNKRKGIAFFVDTEEKCASQKKTSEKNLRCAGDPKKETSKEKFNNRNVMYIPSLETKNKQYKSKFCNVLNNKPESSADIYESGLKLIGKSNENSIFILTEKNSTSNHNQIQETSSLDRHLFTKNLFETDRVAHKPPKGVRRNSSKSRKNKTTYEYIRKEDYLKKMNNFQNSKNISSDIENQADSIENTLEFNYKEKNLDRECEYGNTCKEEKKILNELYDSLDKFDLNAKIDYDSLEVNINRVPTDEKLYDSLDYNLKNVWDSNCSSWKDRHPFNRAGIQSALENIKILNEIQRTVNKINCLVDIFKQNMYCGKVRTLSQMYERLTNSHSYYNDFPTFRKRNLSLPNFVERRLNVANVDSCKNTNVTKVCCEDLGSASVVQVKAAKPVPGRSNSRYAKNTQIIRSSSTGVLNQSDSDNENSDKKPQSRLMRPTISSQNKVTSSKNLAIRKRQAYSVMNLSTVGQEDSSSEENEKMPVKPIAPPRTRNLTDSSQSMIVPPRRHTSNKEKAKNNRTVTNYERRKSTDLEETLLSMDFHGVQNIDVSTVQLSTQLCDDVAYQLTKASNNVVELYRRLTDTEASTSEQLANLQKTDMVKNLELSIARTLRVLQGLTLEKLKQSNGNFDVNQTNTVKRLNDLVSRGLPRIKTPSLI
ncbi:uncharacterized protein LOC116162536 isoform X2 [Photinus pyralis]|uniref:uncharacterized protein LOC116162536 isoform X2 n=1 Tax=Photinus pyralis TaxID=7054 RepID=UPI001266E782|nr:uncharacterized protein LOC116162536 isoform X2 [Photinus pyralis]